MKTNRKFLRKALRRVVLAVMVGLGPAPGSALLAAPQPRPGGPAKVEVRKTGDRYQLQVNGQPFYIKGAGLEFGNPEKLAEHGGNSFRTWRTENGRTAAGRCWIGR